MLLETKNREKYETGNVGYAYEIWRHGLPLPRRPRRRERFAADADNDAGESMACDTETRASAASAPTSPTSCAAFRTASSYSCVESGDDDITIQ